MASSTTTAMVHDENKENKVAVAVNVNSRGLTKEADTKEVKVLDGKSKIDEPKASIASIQHDLNPTENSNPIFPDVETAVNSETIAKPPATLDQTSAAVTESGKSMLLS